MPPPMVIKVLMGTAKEKTCSITSWPAMMANIPMRAEPTI